MGWEPCGGLGHLKRLRPLAQASLEAGHKVESCWSSGLSSCFVLTFDVDPR